MLKIKGWDLKFFSSGEWQVIDERLKELEKVNRRIGKDGYFPGRSGLFSALRTIRQDEVRAAFIGQDFQTETFFEEFRSDLGYPIPDQDSFSGWASSGVLLWNAIPTSRSSGVLPHDWEEYRYLTGEIIDVLSKKGIVFVLLGQLARSYLPRIDLRNNAVITTSHPSPRGNAGKTAFTGSRIFSTVNDKLVNNGLEPIDWTTNEQKPTRTLSSG